MASFLSIVGARPQFIKLAPLSRVLRERHTEIILHTGQHYTTSMSDRLFTDLALPQPDYNLGVGSGTHGEQTARMLSGIEGVIERERPNCVIVFGDTNSTLAGALSAAKQGILTVHIEAGLRSFNRTMPEEINRIVADHVADLLFAPTPTAMLNLEKEGLAHRAHLTGDIMVDTLEENRERAVASSNVLARLNLKRGAYTLLTLHRPYNVDDPAFTPNILASLAELGDQVVFPVHPRTRAVMESVGIGEVSNTVLCEPQGYLDFVQLQANAKRIVTDSGGVQKEAYLLGVPCITVRPETEWLETVGSGWNVLADPRSPTFLQTIREFSPDSSRPPIFGVNVASRIRELLEQAVEAIL